MSRKKLPRSTIDIETEECFRLSEGPERIGVTYWRLWNYIHRGVVQQSPPGAIVNLEHIFLGTILGTSREAWMRFHRKINGQ